MPGICLARPLSHAMDEDVAWVAHVLTGEGNPSSARPPSRQFRVRPREPGAPAQPAAQAQQPARRRDPTRVFKPSPDVAELRGK